MSSTAGRKTPGRTNPKRGEAAILGFDPFEYLLNRAIAEKNVEKKDRLAFELLPYVKPKLRSVEVKGDMSVTVTVTIGGIE